MCWLLPVPFSTWLPHDELSVAVPVSHDDDVSESPLLLCSLLSSGLPLLLCDELNACISHFCSCLISSWWSWNGTESGRTTMKLMRKNVSAVIPRQESWINEFLVDMKMRLQWNKFSALCTIISAHIAMDSVWIKSLSFSQRTSSTEWQCAACINVNELFLPDRNFFVLQIEFGISEGRNSVFNRWWFDSFRYRRNFPFPC